MGGGGRPVGPFQPLGDGGVQPRPAAGRDPVVQHRPVEVVVEAEPRRHRPVRPGHRAGGPQEAAVAGQRRAALLGRLDVRGPVGGGRGGGELDPGDGGRLQHGQVGGVQPLELELEQAAEVVGDLGIVAGWTRRQLPAARRRPQDAGVGPGLGELDDEQRDPVGSPVHQPGQLLGDVGPGEVAAQDRGDRLGAELAEPELVGQPPQPQLGAGVADRGAAGEGVGRPVGADHQQPGRDVPPGQPLQQVDGRGVGPVQVLEDQDQGPVRGGGLQRLGRLPQHPLPGPAEGPPFQVGPVGGLDQRRHLGQPGRGEAGQQRRRPGVDLAQTVEGVEDRQVRLWRAPLLETLATGDQPRPLPPDLAGERLHQRRLPDAGLAGDEHDLPPPLPGEVVQPAQPLQLRLPPDRGHAVRERRRGGARLRLLDRGEELVAAAVDGADHPPAPGRCRRPPCGRPSPGWPAPSRSRSGCPRSRPAARSWATTRSRWRTR